MAAAEQRGDVARMTVDEFCDAYYDRVVGLAVRAFGGPDAEDVAHEALSRVVAAYDSLDPRRDAWPWLATVVRNAGREALRRRATLPIEEAETVAAPDEAFDLVAADEERRTLARALRRVPPEDRAVLLMRVRDELSYAEIAARTGRTSGALRIQAVRARRRLAQEFARLGGTAYGVTALATARLRDRAAGAAAALSAAAQVAVAAVVCGTVVVPAPDPGPRVPVAAPARGGAAAATPAGAGAGVVGGGATGAVASATATRTGAVHGAVAGEAPAPERGAGPGAVRGVGVPPADPKAAPPHGSGPHHRHVEVDVAGRVVRVTGDGSGTPLRCPAGC